jgi:hypothetical protein
MKRNPDMTRLLLLFSLFAPFLAQAQLPDCDIWLFSYYMQDNNYFFTGGMNVSNHKGYDNQPSFSSSGTYMLWTAQRDSNETDIFRYDLTTHTTMRITQTRYSEYSPTYMEGNKYISAVVVEKDSVQRLWKYNKLNGQAKPVLPKVFGVGYHYWYDASKVFLFQVTEPSTLVLAEVHSGATKNCAKNVGRCMGIYRSMKEKMLLYTQEADSALWIKALDSKGNRVESFMPVKMMNGVQDFAVDRKGNILSAKDAKLYEWTIGTSTEWKPIADFSGNGVKHITRISISPDNAHIAFVDNSN